MHNGSGQFRSRLERAFLSAVRMYTYNTPVARGKYRLQEAAMTVGIKGARRDITQRVVVLEILVNAVRPVAYRENISAATCLVRERVANIQRCLVA